MISKSVAWSPSGISDSWPRLGMFIWEDPPEHTAYRNIVSRVFSPRRMNELDGKIRAYCAKCLDPLIGSKRIDFIADLGAKLPGGVIGMLLGIPEQDRDAFRDRVEASLRTEAGQPMRVEQTSFHGEGFEEYVDWRAQNPSSDLMTELLAAEYQDVTGTRRKLTREEVLIFVNVIAGAGNEITNRLIGWEYCSPDQGLVLHSTTPEEGTLSLVIPDAALPLDSITYEVAEDGRTDRWGIYDNVPAGAQISTVFDNDRQSNVIQFSGAGADNGYRLRNSDGTLWNNASHFIIKWDMKYSEPFSVYIDLNTTAGHRYLQYRPLNSNSLGDGEYIFYGLGTDANNNRWHTFVRDLQADVKVAQPNVTILAVNGFLIRGSGRVDNIELLTMQEGLSPSLRLTLFDPDNAGEGMIYINGNGPVNLPTGSYDNIEHTFEVPISAGWLVQGENRLRFMHVSAWGYEVRGLCVRGLTTGPITTTTTAPVIPPSSTTTTTVISDVTPPVGSITINQGEENQLPGSHS